MTAGLLLASLVLASGAGRWLLGPVRLDTAWRTVAAQYLLGGLLAAAALGLAGQLGLPFPLVVVLAGVFLLAGLAGCLWPSDTALPRWRLALAAGLGLLLLPCLLVPAAPVAVDPGLGLYLAARVFHQEWFVANEPLLSAASAALAGQDAAPAGQFASSDTLLTLSRLPALAPLWPTAALGLPLGIESVFQVAAWLLLVAALLFADALVGALHWTWRLLFAAGALGAFNVMSVSIGGQLWQPFALAAAIGVVWLCRHTDRPRARLPACFLLGAAIAGGYPEFLLALPLYLACAPPPRRAAWRTTLRESAAVLAGVALVLLTTRGGTLTYLLLQGGQPTGWSPLARAPDQPLWFLRALLLPETPWWAPLLLYPPALLLARRLPACRGGAPAPAWPVWLGALALLAVWYALVQRAGNANYAAFKLAGWGGPALLLLAWAARPTLPPRPGWLLGAAVLALALARAAVLPTVVPHDRPTYPPAAALYREDAPTAASGCVIHVDASDLNALLRAIAWSAAPWRGCPLDRLPKGAPALAR